MDAEDLTGFYIGLDDTDNAESRGTGYLARMLAHILEKRHVATVEGITRHQLFIHPAIRYTSHNSSACLDVRAASLEKLISTCCEYLLNACAAGSDAGLCICRSEEVNDETIDFGQLAKHTVCSMQEALLLARNNNIFLQGLTGNHEGVIGAIAAVGLRAGGNDGRFIWLSGKKELREIVPGSYTVRQLLEILHIEEISTLQGEKPRAADRVRVDEWLRPVLKHHKGVIIIEKSENNNGYEWKLSPKEIIRAIS